MPRALGKAPFMISSHFSFRKRINCHQDDQSMSLDKDDVVNIAHLARLAINAKDIPEYAKNLSSILDLVEQMQQVNTDSVEPMAHPLDSTQRLREDAVTESNERDLFQSIAPAVEAGLYLVPKVIE